MSSDASKTRKIFGDLCLAVVVWLFFFYFEGRNNVSDEMVCDSVVCSINCIVIYCKVKVERDVYIGKVNLEFQDYDTK